MNQEQYKIGVIFSDFITHSADALLEKIAIAFQNKNHYVVFMNTLGDIEREKQAITYMTEQMDGIILISNATNYAEISDCIPENYPVIFLLNMPENCEKTAIIENDYSAIYQGLINCINSGSKRIAFVTKDITTPVGRSYLRAYEDAINSTPISFDSNLIYTVDPTAVEPTKLFTKIIADGCDTIFCTGSHLSITLSDCLAYYNNSEKNQPIAFLGYGVSELNAANALSMDRIVHSTEQFVDLSYQQLIYQITHPDADKKKQFQIKGSLQMRKYNGLNVN